MKYLNLGCGSHYNSLDIWTNLDFVSSSPAVIAHNLLKGIPFKSNYFDVVYHSHVLEHFKEADAKVFINECFRVLKPEGTIRIAVPDLEQICRNYLACLDEAIVEQSPAVAEKYDWTMIEMYDQTVREKSGGRMLDFLRRDHNTAKEFVKMRMGAAYDTMLESIRQHDMSSRSPGVKTAAKNWLKKVLFYLRFLRQYKVGKFRSEGEIHQWMYDRYSLSRLLKQAGFRNISTTSAFESRIPGWASYELDGKNGMVRKPDSLFVEATK